MKSSQRNESERARKPQDRNRSATSIRSGEWRQVQVCPKRDLGQRQSYTDTDTSPPATRAVKETHRDKEYLKITTAAFSFQRF